MSEKQHHHDEPGDMQFSGNHHQSPTIDSLVNRPGCLYHSYYSAESLNSKHGTCRIFCDVCRVLHRDSHFCLPQSWSIVYTVAGHSNHMPHALKSLDDGELVFRVNLGDTVIFFDC